MCAIHISSRKSDQPGHKDLSATRGEGQSLTIWTYRVKEIMNPQPGYLH